MGLWFSLAGLIFSGFFLLMSVMGPKSAADKPFIFLSLSLSLPFVSYFFGQRLGRKIIDDESCSYRAAFKMGSIIGLGSYVAVAFLLEFLELITGQVRGGMFPVGVLISLIFSIPIMILGGLWGCFLRLIRKKNMSV